LREVQMIKTVAVLIKETLSCLLTIQEIMARPEVLSEDDKAVIVAACDDAVWKLLAADGEGHGGQAIKNAQGSRSTRAFPTYREGKGYAG